MHTESAPLERQRSFNLYDFSAADSGHLCYVSVEK